MYKNPTLEIQNTDLFMREVIQKEKIIKSQPNPGSQLTGFFETLGPKRVNPASAIVNQFWVNALITILFREKEEAKRTNNQNIKKIQLLTSMMEYPQNSNAENYILLPEFLSDAAIEEILQLIITKIYTVTGDISKRDSLIEKLKTIHKRHLLSLMVFTSRNSKETELNTLLTTHFFDMKSMDENNFSNDIKTIFFDFINNEKSANYAKLFISRYINQVINGTFGKSMWIIYKNGYQKKSFMKRDDTPMPLSEELVIKRTNQWLQDVDNKMNLLPIGYIYDIFSESERRIIMKERNVCKEISELTNQLGKYPIHNIELPGPGPVIFKSTSVTKGGRRTRKFLEDKLKYHRYMKSGGIKNKTRKTGV